jgi:thiol-disulfide isomerase/thioredoxin
MRPDPWAPALRLALGTALILLLAAAAEAQERDASSRAGASRSAGQNQDNPQWKAYAFELPNVSGKGKLSFADLARGGKPFVLFFWRTDCPLCHMQIPYVQQLQRLIDEGKADLRLVTVNLDDRPEDCQDYIEEKGLSFSVLYDGHARRTNAEYEIKDLGVPLTYIFADGGEFKEHITGFRSELSKSVLKALDLPLPDEVKEK